MSEPVTTWRPLIDFDEAEQHASEIDAAYGNDIAARAKRLRLVGGELIEAARAPATVRAVDPAPSEEPVEPIFHGDFAEIEAALLRTALLSVTTPSSPEPHETEPLESSALESRPPESRSSESRSWEFKPWTPPVLRAMREEPDPDSICSLAALSVVAPDAPEDQASRLSVFRAPAGQDGSPKDFMLFDDAAVSGGAAMADEDKRSRRPLYIMAALVFAGIAGIAATSFRQSGSPEVTEGALRIPPIAPAPSDSGAAPAAPSQNAALGADAPAQQASAAQEATQAVDTAASERPVPADAAQRVISFSEPAAPAEPPATLPGAAGPASAGSSILAAEPVAKTPALASIGEAKKVKTAAVRPDGSLIKPEAAAKTAAPKAASAKDAAVKTPKVAHLNQPNSGAAKPPGAAKTVSTTAKPAVAAVKAKPAPDAQAAQAAPAADAQPVAATPKPAGPLAFVDTAVSSIQGATGKLLDWGRTASGAH
jgi:hypothetical protein